MDVRCPPRILQYLRMYQIIDHTADVGIRVEAATKEGLFVRAAEAVFDLLIASKRPFIPSIEIPIQVEAPAIDQLFVRWLQELLFVFEKRRLVLMKFWIDGMNETNLSGKVKGLPFDSARHTQKLDIKAVTYHQLKVEQDEAGLWHAQVIFDI